MVLNDSEIGLDVDSDPFNVRVVVFYFKLVAVGDVNVDLVLWLVDWVCEEGVVGVIVQVVLNRGIFAVLTHVGEPRADVWARPSTVLIDVVRVVRI